MNRYLLLHLPIKEGARTCAQCQNRKCLEKEDPYCEKLQKAFRSVLGINAEIGELE